MHNSNHKKHHKKNRDDFNESNDFIDDKNDNSNDNDLDFESKFEHLQKVIEEKEKFLKEKNNNLNKLTSENEYLNGIKKDYKTHYDFMKFQQDEQIEAFKILKNYVDNLTKTGALSEANLLAAKADSQRILNEINQIKLSIKNLINDSGMPNNKEIEQPLFDHTEPTYETNNNILFSSNTKPEGNIFGYLPLKIKKFK